MLRQKPARCFILNVYMRETFEHASRARTVPMEETLGGTEDSRNAIGGNTAFLERFEISRPELVLDEYCHAGLKRLNEFLSLATRGEGKIEHAVRQLIVLACLVARRTEECNNYFLLSILLYSLYQRTGLLELAHRRCMNPYGPAACLQQSFVLRVKRRTLPAE